MPRDEDQNLEQAGYQLTLLQCLLIATVILYYIQKQMAIKPLPKLLALKNTDSLQDLQDYLRKLRSETVNLNAQLHVAVDDLFDKIRANDKATTFESIIAHLKESHPEQTPILICGLRIEELKNVKNKNLAYPSRTLLIEKIEASLIAEYSKQGNDKSKITMIGWLLQHLHQIDEFCLQLAAAQKEVRFTDIGGLTALIMHVAIQQCYMQFAELVDKPGVTQASANNQLKLFENIMTELYNSVKHQRNMLNANTYKPFIQRLDQILKRAPVALYTDDMEAVAHVLLAKNPHFVPKPLSEAGTKQRYWVSYCKTVEETLPYHHTATVLSHQESEKSDILIDHCVGYYSGQFYIFGTGILKPICADGAKLKPEKVPYMLLPQLYYHWEITADEFKILNDEIKGQLFKSNNFNVVNKNCKTHSMSLLSKIGIYRPEIEGGMLGWVPRFTDGLKRGTMRECAILKDEKLVSRDKWDCSPLVWGNDAAPQLRLEADHSPGFLKVQMENNKVAVAKKKY